MGKSVAITCDACKKDFKLEAQDIRLRQSGEVLFKYFVCPECNTAFLINATDKEFRKLLNKGKMNANQHREIQDILNDRYYRRFKELFPNAYEAKAVEVTQ